MTPSAGTSTFTRWSTTRRDENLKINLGMKWGLEHVGYWENEKFYEGIVQQFL